MTETINEENNVNTRSAAEIRVAEELRTLKRNRFLRKQKIITAIFYIVLFSIIILTFLPVSRTLNYEYHTNNILHRIKFLYKGNFEIISPQLEDPNMRVTPNGLYEIKAENGITFKATQYNSDTSMDYEQRVFKEMVLNYIDSHPDNNVYYEEGIQQGYGDLFDFKFGVDISGYDNIDASIVEMYDLRNYIIYHAEEYFNNKGSFTIYVKLDDFEDGLVNYYILQTQEQFINEFKFDYANYLRTLSSPSGDVKLAELSEFNKPEEIKIFINDELTNYYNDLNQFTLIKAKYNLTRSEYRVNMTHLEKYLRDYCTFNRIYGSKLDSLIYKEKKYKFVPVDKTKYEITNDKVPYEWSIEQIQEFFDADIKYDLENESVYITFSKDEEPTELEGNKIENDTKLTSGDS